MRNGNNVLGMLCVPDGGNNFNTGGSGGEGVIGGERNSSDFNRIDKDTMEHDTYEVR